MAARKQNRRNKRAPAKQAVTRQEQFARLIVLSMFSVSFVVLLLWQVQQWFMDPDTLPIRQVKIEGSLKHLQMSTLENAVAGEVSGGYFNIDLSSVQNAAQKLAWVEGVSITRRWPDTLVMYITEKTAMARWGNDRLVTARGVVFSPEQVKADALPMLLAEDARSVDVVEVYQRETERFLQHGLTIKQVSLSDRGAWSLEFTNGLQVAVGRVDVEARLQRLVNYLQALKQYKKMPESIDLRYLHGMAVNFGKPEEQDEEKTKVVKEAV